LEQQNGWEVSGEAANGREAIEKAQELRPDLIVLDLAMPVMNGLEAARALKRLLPRVPVLMFTNFDAAPLKREALAAGIRAVVSKSGSLQSLVSAIQGLLEPAA
jgi:DNA-binding NarL/FixJ family response regulator